MSSAEENDFALELDKAKIRECVSRFADAATFAQLEPFRALWADDGEWTIGEPFARTARGLEAIERMVRQLWAPNQFFIHFPSTPIVEVDGGRARARCLIREEAKGPDKRFYRNWAVSHDELRRTGSTWSFTRRRYEYLLLDLAPFPGDTFMTFPALGS